MATFRVQSPEENQLPALARSLYSAIVSSRSELQTSILPALSRGLSWEQLPATAKIVVMRVAARLDVPEPLREEEPESETAAPMTESEEAAPEAPEAA